jgi:hypothetical protein
MKSQDELSLIFPEGECSVAKGMEDTVTIVADDGRVTVPWSLLSKNEVFRVMMQSGMREAQERSVTLQSSKAEVETFVRLLFQNRKQPLALRDAVSVLGLARFCNERWLVEAAEGAVGAAPVGPETFADLLAFAVRENVEALQSKCVDVLAEAILAMSVVKCQLFAGSFQRCECVQVPVLAGKASGPFADGKVVLVACARPECKFAWPRNCPCCRTLFYSDKAPKETCPVCTKETVLAFTDRFVVRDAEFRRLSVAGQILRTAACIDLSLLEAVALSDLSVDSFKQLLAPASSLTFAEPQPPARMRLLLRRDPDLRTLSDEQLVALLSRDAPSVFAILSTAVLDQKTFWELMERPVVRGVVATAFLGLCASPELWWEKEARWLIEERGAAIDDALTHCGLNPLHVASLVGLEDSVAWLLSRGASVDRRVLRSGAHGATAQETALHIAARSGHAAVAQMLISAGADAALWDDRKRTPCAAAFAAGHPAMAQLLQISRHGVRAANSAGAAAASSPPH